MSKILSISTFPLLLSLLAFVILDELTRINPDRQEWHTEKEKKNIRLCIKSGGK
jgi:hypothetical protein